MSSQFYLGNSNESATSVSSTSSDLPFPTALPREDFLAASFNPAAYLTSLGNRHQTLEDLRSELRARSQLLNQELLDLVNSHYADFIGLGDSLKGGEEKIEELRVGVLGFQRELHNIKKEVVKREKDVQSWLAKRKLVTRDLVLGKTLLELDSRLERLEEKLLLKSQSRNSNNRSADGNFPQIQQDELEDISDDEISENSEEDDGDDETRDELDVSMRRLCRRVHDLKVIVHLMCTAGSKHPFIVARVERVTTTREVLSSDAQSILKQLQAADTHSSESNSKLPAVFRDLKILDQVMLHLQNTT